MQTLVDIQIKGIDPTIPIEVRIGIVVWITTLRAVGQLVQIQVQSIGITVVVQIPVTHIAVIIPVGIPLDIRWIDPRGKRAIRHIDAVISANRNRSITT